MPKKIRTMVMGSDENGIARCYYANAEIRSRVLYILNVDKTHPLSDDEIAEFNRREGCRWFEFP